mmetsp:Transcript_18468/g.56713  ORF Transcript_18468/g.56713 Transcript_18468/m.56713 type:complete len:111 (-) Transcript_18468:767-1099(-)
MTTWIRRLIARSPDSLECSLKSSQVKSNRTTTSKNVAHDSLSFFPLRSRVVRASVTPFLVCQALPPPPLFDFFDRSSAPTKEIVRTSPVEIEEENTRVKEKKRKENSTTK